MPRAKKPAGQPKPVETFVHTEEQRMNIPTAELETFMKDEDRLPKKVTYPRPSDLLYPRDAAGDPQLVWRGKDDQDRRPLEVTAPPIYIQEKIHPKAIIEDLRKLKRGEAPAQADLFDDFNGIEFEDLVDFYEHEQHWSNRLILGDSLEVMTSLAERETLKGQVQCIYMDPPYGVKFNSNWQVSTRSREVTDGDATDATRQPEQIRAFRDTWALGIHSYLGYLRDRLVAARELLAPTGSLFVQISDENMHLVRGLTDEVFGSANFVVTIVVKKKGATTPTDPVNDYLLWIAKDRNLVRARHTFERRSRPENDPKFNTLISPKGDHVRVGGLADNQVASLEAQHYRWARVNYPLVSQHPSPTRSRDFLWNGRTYSCGSNNQWRFNPDTDLPRLGIAGRLFDGGGRSLGGVAYWEDWPYVTRSNVWDDLHGAQDSIYVVQTNRRVVERCLLMTTDPGDLVLDPTCGSGTTAYVAEYWGRRWITIDTSRVALALARQRVMTARMPSFRLEDAVGRDLRRGFVYKSVPRVTLKSIATNPEIRDGMTREQIEAAIARRAEHQTLRDQPEADAAIIRVTGPFTVESPSPNSGAPSVSDRAEPGPPHEVAGGFVAGIIDNLQSQVFRTQSGTSASPSTVSYPGQDSISTR